MANQTFRILAKCGPINKRRSIQGLLWCFLLALLPPLSPDIKHYKRPNILIVISDDQSFPHASAYGGIPRTPHFDRIAREGALFTRAHTCCASCSPSRASLLTGRHVFQLEGASILGGPIAPKFPTYPDILESEGYKTGYTGKGWGPGASGVDGRDHDPVGWNYNDHKIDRDPSLSECDITKNFEEFLDEGGTEKPFCFWIGSTEPHRPYRDGVDLEMGVSLDDVELPPQCPQRERLRRYFARYYGEIMIFDQQLGDIIKVLEERHMMDNTIIVVTSDNGVHLPRSKTTLYDLGTHVPLAIRWPERIPSGQVLDDFVLSCDLAPTLLECAGIDVPTTMTGESLLDYAAGRTKSFRQFAITAQERHVTSYPARAIRTKEYSLIHSFKTDDEFNRRARLGGRGGEDFKGKEPVLHDTIELFNTWGDPNELNDLSKNPAYQEMSDKLGERLRSWCIEQEDPRYLGGASKFNEYPEYLMRWVRENPEIAKQSREKRKEINLNHRQWLKSN